jgi:Na+-driven multidrug efflux pump
MAAGVMALFAVLCHLGPAAMIRIFSSDPEVIAVGDEYLRIVSWNFVASGVVFVCSSTFQAMGNTIPALMSSFARVAVVVVPTILLSRVPGFHLRWIWYMTVASVTLQMILSLLLIRLEFRSRLELPAPAPAPAS